MMSEYAVDPACVKQVDELLRVLAGVGGEHGRLVADFPGGWAKKVLETAKRIGVPGVRQTMLSRRLQLIRHAVIETGHQYDDTSAWFTNASTAAPAFRAVVSPEQTGCPHLIALGTELEESDHWSVERGRRVPRKAADLAAVALPLLRNAREVILVDPHFEPGAARFGRPLVAFLQAATRPGKKLSRCEYHLKAKTTDESFQEKCAERVAPFLPAGTSITFFRWKQRAGGDDLHGRYVLTESGGLQFDVGLDEGTAGETTPVVLVPEKLWRDHRADFSAGGATFERGGDAIRVTKAADGTASVERLQ